MRYLSIWLISIISFLPLGANKVLLNLNENYSAASTMAEHASFNFNDNGDKNVFYNMTMAEVDAEADLYTPPNKVYTYDEARSLRNSLENLVHSNKKSLGLYWALLRYYSGAADFVGGTAGSALQYASYIYSLNPYIGCLAYEFAYTKLKDLNKAYDWYQRSLSIALPTNMIWQEIKYNNVVITGIKVTGNFNNWKTQNMYQIKDGTYSRKVLMPKCETCDYKILVDYRTTHNPSALRQSLIFNN
ncbi:MAG: hypothetical protein C0459_14245 [Chitinophaga sp.]|jgi:hypothetical protein|nr:hypothetical protein [Chitinophaga sp.]